MDRTPAKLACVLAVAALLFPGMVGALDDGGRQDPLVTDQRTVLERMREVEKRLIEMARDLEQSDPIRAGQLMNAVTAARKEFIVDDMGVAVRMLEEERYGEAEEVQQEVLNNLRTLLDALSVQQWRTELARLEEHLRILDDLIGRQQHAAEDGAGRGDLEEARREQQGILRDTEALLSQMQDGRTGRSGPGSENVGKARDPMARAVGSLEKGDRTEAAGRQREALNALEAARQELRDAMADLKRARQRELLARLEKMFREMLASQHVILADTVDADRALAGLADIDREQKMQVHALAVRERELLSVAHEAKVLLEEDGTSVALPSAVDALKAHIERAAGRLDKLDVGKVTQAIERDVEDTLKALIAALRATRDRRANDPQDAARQQREGRKGMPSLVSVLQELKVLRALQGMLNQRTERLDAWREAGELPQELEGLRQGQARLREMAMALLDTAPLSEVVQRMANVEDLLARGSTGRETQARQGEIVGLLDVLIAAVEGLQRSGGAGAQAAGKEGEGRQPAPPAGNRFSVRPADRSTLPGGEWQHEASVTEPGPDEHWLAVLPPAEREKVVQAFQDGLVPLRYRVLLEQYSVRLADEPAP